MARPIKAVGPIVVALMMAPTAGVFGMAHLLTHQRPLEWVVLIATKLGFSGHVGGIAAGLIVFVLAAVATGLVGYIGLRGIGRLYKAQWISDQSLQVDAVWLVFAVAQVPGEPFAGLAAFVIYELVVRLGLHVFCPGKRADSRRPGCCCCVCSHWGDAANPCSGPSRCCGAIPARCA